MTRPTPSENRVIEEFAKLGRTLGRARSIPEAARVIVDTAKRLVGCDCGFVNVFPRDTTYFETVYSVDTIDGERVESTPSGRRDGAAAWMARVVPNGPRIIDSDQEAIDAGLLVFGSGRRCKSRMFAPISTEDSQIGVISIQSYRQKAYDKEDLRLLVALADHCAGAFERVLAEAELIDLNRDLETRVEMRTAELRESNDELSRATRLKDEFLASMSHELRTPLNAVLGLTEALREGVYGELTDRQVKPMARIEESGRHLLELINDILDLSKIEAGKLDLAVEEFRVEDLARQAVRFVQQQAMRKNLDVSVDIHPEAETARGDARRIKQALVNLLTNAVKFTPSGGAIGLDVVPEPSAGMLAMTVHDTGIGIPRQQQHKLFKPFVQLDSALTREHAGTGLGLALVRRLMDLHNGSVTVESAADRGSRFTIRIPWEPRIAKSDARRILARESGEVSVPLPLEDLSADMSAGQSLRRVTGLLRQRGWRIHHSRTDGSAIRIDGGSRPDLVVFDASSSSETLARLVGRVGKVTALSGIPAIFVGSTDTIDYATLAELAVLEAEGEPMSRIEALVGDLVEGLEGGSALVLTAGAKERVRVLVAEDNQIIRNSLSEYLRAKGCDVVTAVDGVAALKAATEHAPDIILLDIQMPRMSGFDVLRQLRLEYATIDTPVIALTALAMPGDRERCLAAGATDYLAKPVSLRELSDKVLQYVPGGDADANEETGDDGG